MEINEIERKVNEYVEKGILKIVEDNVHLKKYNFKDVIEITIYSNDTYKCSLDGLDKIVYRDREDSLEKFVEDNPLEYFNGNEGLLCINDGEYFKIILKRVRARV